MTLGEKLQSLRKENMLSQEKVAELVGVSRQAVSKWETNLSNPDTKNLIRLSEIFNVSVDEITAATLNCKQMPLPEKGSAIHYKIFLPIAAYTGFMINSKIISNVPGFYVFTSMSIFIAGILMVWNLWRESDNQRRLKNALIELCYCLIIYTIMTFGTKAIGNVYSGVIVLACAIIYLLVINPKYLKRTIFDLDKK